MTPDELAELAKELSDIDTADAVETCPAAARITVATDD
jgi:histone H3/H4